MSQTLSRIARSGMVIKNVNSDYTAKSGDFIFADTSSAAFTITLPANPNEGDAVSSSDAKSTFDSNNLTVARNGQTIMGLTEDMIVDNKNAGFCLTFVNNDWRLV